MLPSLNLSQNEAFCLNRCVYFSKSLAMYLEQMNVNEVSLVSLCDVIHCFDKKQGTENQLLYSNKSFKATYSLHFKAFMCTLGEKHWEITRCAIYSYN